jgi:hypothetical protein
MSSTTAAATATATATAAIAASYAASLPLPPLPARPTQAMGALALLPPRRRPVLRAGRTTNPTRPSNLEAELGQIVGQARNLRPCVHCIRGQGVWTVCVVVAGFFGGSCANCHYGSEGARCSLRKYSLTVY